MSTILNVGKALRNLGINNYVIRADGLIDTEEKFNNAFTIVTGVDEDENSIESSDPNDWGVTWSQVKEEMDKL